jgi:hypothetical protein
MPVEVVVIKHWLGCDMRIKCIWCYAAPTPPSLLLNTGYTAPIELRLNVIWKTGIKSNVYANKHGQNKTAALLDYY